MAIPEKNIDDCTQVKVDLCKEIKKRVIEKRDEIRSKGMTCSKEKAIKEIIKEWSIMKYGAL